MSDVYPTTSIEVRTLPEAVLVVLSGEHDLSTAPDLERTFAAMVAITPHLIVDLSAAAFVDSSTITALLRAKTRSEAAGHRFNLVLGTAAIVERTLEIARVLAHLNPVASVDDALCQEDTVREAVIDHQNSP